MAQTAERKYFDDHGALEYLKSIGIVSATNWYIHELIRKGQLRAVRVGRKLHVSKDDLDALLAKKKK